MEDLKKMMIKILSGREKTLWSEDHYIYYANHYEDLTDYILEKYVNENPEKLLFMTLKEYDSELYQKYKNSSVTKICTLIGGGPIPTEGEKLEINKKWIGLAIIVISLFGIKFIYKKNKKTSNKQIVNESEEVPTQILALGILDSNFLEDEDIMKNFSNARYWWYGNKDKWDDIKNHAEWQPYVKNYESGIVILVYEWRGNQIINNMFEATSLLKQLTKDKKIKKINILIGSIDEIKQNGFVRQ